MSLAALRAEVAQTLTDADLTAFDHLPGRLVPPVALVAHGTPFLSAGDTFGTHTARWDVVLIVPPGDNDRRTTDLDDLLDAALVALADRYSVDEVTAPYVLDANGAPYAAVRISLLDTITL